MSVAPTAIGQSSVYIRADIQAQLDKIDQIFLADPAWVISQNKASATDQANGAIKFVIQNLGDLNDGELAAASAGWVSAGWTSATAVNDPPSRKDTPDRKTWTLTLIFTP